MIGIGARLAALFASNGLVIGLVAAFGVMIVTWDRGRINAAVNTGVQKERASVYKKSNENAAKAQAARRAADRRRVALFAVRAHSLEHADRQPERALIASV